MSCKQKDFSPRIVAYGDESFDQEWFIDSFVLVRQESLLGPKWVQQMRKHVREQRIMGLLSDRASARIHSQLHETLWAHEYKDLWQYGIGTLRLAFETNPEAWLLLSIRFPKIGQTVTQETRTQAYVTAWIALANFWKRRSPFGAQASLIDVLLDTLPSDINKVALNTLSLNFSWRTGSSREDASLIVADWVAGLTRRAQPHRARDIQHRRIAARCLQDWRVHVQERSWGNSSQK